MFHAGHFAHQNAKAKVERPEILTSVLTGDLKVMGFAEVLDHFAHDDNLSECPFAL